MNRPLTKRETSAGATAARHVVFLGTAHDNGGSSILAGNLAAEMRSRGHHVEEWYLFGSAADPSHARVFAGGGRSRSPFVLLKVCAQVVRALRQAKPDAVIGLQPLANLIAGLAGRLTGVRNPIATLHNPADRFNSLLMGLDRLIGTLGVYRHIVACSFSVAESFAGHGGLYRERLTVVPNGHAAPAMALGDETRRRLGLPERGVVLGQIGRLSEQKNQRFSLELLRSMPEATLVMLGTGPDRTALKSFITQHALGERVRLIDSMPHDRIGDFFSAVDVVLFPSTFEGLSLAAIEAVHAGVPLLCSDIASFREMFASSALLTQHLLLPLDDVDAWRARIETLLADPLHSQIVAELEDLSPDFAFAPMADGYLRLIG